MASSVRILSIEALTRNVRRYRLERPAGYDFQPGQATELSLDLPDWHGRKHPFTFSGLADAPELEFIIKSYFATGGDGMTERLWAALPGDRLVLRDPWGTIAYRGPGVFIAGGAGITPFIAILRDLQARGKLEGHHLVVSYRTREDILLRAEFERMAGLTCTWTVTADPDAEDLLHRRIDADFLARHVDLRARHFYLCGPDPMVSELRSTLGGLGVDVESMIWEK